MPHHTPSRLLLAVLAALGGVVLLTLASCGGEDTTSAPGGAAGLVTPSLAPAQTAIQTVPTTRIPLPTDAMAATRAPTAAPATAAARTAAPTGAPLPAQPSATAAPSPTVVAANPPNLSSVQLELQPLVSGLEAPVGLANAGDGSGRLFVLEKAGIIRVIQDGTLAEAPFLDITSRVGSSGSEQGLLGLAFHPDFANNGVFFVNYTNRSGDTVVSRFVVEGGEAADPAREQVVLEQDQPAANHNGGHLAFGPDGYLYIGLGDGGGAGDTFGTGQTGGALLGKMLRVDVDGGDPYVVPEDNPFTDLEDVRPEIWAIGLRNPWRYSFDRATGDLYIADVGQGDYEEINVQSAASQGGENYGWPIMEGAHCFRADSCDQDSLVRPVAEYTHADGCSVTGGYVYRGSEFLALAGVYLFGDYCSGRIWGLVPLPDGTWSMAELAQASIRLSSFGEDEAGELYVADAAGGAVLKVTARAGTSD